MNEKIKMTANEALDFMRKTGKSVRAIPVPFGSGNEDIAKFQQSVHYRLYQGDVLLTLYQDTACASRVGREMSLEYWGYLNQFDYLRFEEYEGLK